jgi:hypothetical protein
VVVGKEATHSVEPPDAKVTDPVAAPGSPVALRLSLSPYVMLVGLAAVVNDVAARPTVNAVDAVEPASSRSPE